MMPEGVLLDTSFFIRFLNDEDPLFTNADGYFRYLLQQTVPLVISTISIAEYCVYGSVDELPLRNLIVLPFNFEHAVKTGIFAKALYQKRKSGELTVTERPIIINDAKLFAQADVEHNITHYITSDNRSYSLFDTLKNELSLNFNFIDLNISHTETFGLLDL